MKCFTTNNVHTVFEFSNLKSFFSYEQFFYKSLAWKLCCFPPTRFLCDFTPAGTIVIHKSDDHPLADLKVNSKIVKSNFSLIFNP